MKPGLTVWIPWSALTAFLGWFEIRRIRSIEEEIPGRAGWLAGWDSEVTLPLFVLLLLPALCLIIAPYAGWGSSQSRNAVSKSSGSRGFMMIGTLLSAAVSFAASFAVGNETMQFESTTGPRTVHLRDLPPTYHDEFSYLLQARTFLAGRWSWPAHEKSADLFHQVHVLDSPATASRYFPWTGIWMAPWVAIGHPFLGHWIAGAITASFCFLAAAQLMDRRAALMAGILVGASPAMAVFSNMLLAHHPAVMALSIFLWAFLRLLRDWKIRYAVISGIGLTLAMLGRPMTAAGFAFPCGLWLVIQVIRELRTRDQRLSPWKLIAAFAVPLAFGFATLAVQNHAITGNWLKSAYQLYTDTWTPRHRYGFHNVSNSPLPLSSSSVMRPYDEWASELTVPVALHNTWQRLTASLMWTLGLAPLLFGCGVVAITAGNQLFRSASAKPKPQTSNIDRRLMLVFGGIVSLHLAHIPYWYTGILDWHYVFETAPLLIILMSAGLAEAIVALTPRLGERRAALWTCGLILSVLIPGWVSAPPLWGRSKIAMAVNTQSMPRVRMAQFEDLKSSNQLDRPCLILVDERGANAQLSFVINPPMLDSEVLVCRRPETDQRLEQLKQDFPGRSIYQFDPTGFLLTKVADR